MINDFMFLTLSFAVMVTVIWASQILMIFSLSREKKELEEIIKYENNLTAKIKISLLNKRILEVSKASNTFIMLWICLILVYFILFVFKHLL